MFKKLIDHIFSKTTNDISCDPSSQLKWNEIKKTIKILEKAGSLNIIRRTDYNDPRIQSSGFTKRTVQITQNLSVCWDPCWEQLKIMVKTSQGISDVTEQDGPWNKILRDYVKILKTKIKEENARLESLEQRKKELAITEFDNNLII